MATFASTVMPKKKLSRLVNALMPSDMPYSVAVSEPVIRPSIGRKSRVLPNAATDQTGLVG